jgi:Ni,Fe-hydrogenase maturation factor
MKRKILVFGNPYLEYDSLAVEIAKDLMQEKNSDAEFIICTSPEQMMEQKFDMIMDVVEGIDDIRVFDNLKLLNPHRMFSLHDFDVTFFLSLLERLGKIEKVRIIGIPAQLDREKAKDKVRVIIINNS